MTAQPFRIVEVLFEGLTQLDFTGPHTIFSRLPGIETIVVSKQGGEVTSDGGLTFARTRPIGEIDRCDLLFVPGGIAATDVILDRSFLGEIQRLAKDARYLTSVCTGSLILGGAGLLQGRRAACHWAWRDLLSLFGAIVDEGRIVRDGNLITGGGVTAGIDFALEVAAELVGKEMAQMIQLQIEYAPAPPFNAGRPETAPAKVMEMIQQGLAPIMTKRRADAERAAAML